MDNNSVALAAIGLVGAVLTAVVVPLFKLLDKQTKAHERVAKSMDKVADSNEKIAKETKRGADEAKQRNGHLADLVVECKDSTIEAVKAIKGQPIVEQTVEHQTIKETRHESK